MSVSLPINESTPMNILAVVIEVTVQADQRGPLIQGRRVLVEGGSVRETID